MKLKYYLMSLAVATTLGFAMTACDDDSTLPGNEQEITFDGDILRVKAGEENMLPLPIATGNGDYKAFSLDKSIADVHMIDGEVYVEGFKNGSTYVVVSDQAGKYVRYPISVYTTDVMELSTTDLSMISPLGLWGSDKSAYVVLGNGGYTISADNADVNPEINEETGEITINAKSRIEPYTATVTVEDCSGLTAEMTVTVNYTDQAFTEEDIEELCQLTTNTCYVAAAYYENGVYAGHMLDEHSPYYWTYINYNGYGDIYRGTSVGNGMARTGWWMILGATNYGGFYIEYPEGTAVDTPVTGSLKFQYSSSQWWPCHDYTGGTVTIVRDDASCITVTYSQLDLEAECLNYGYVNIKK